MQPNAEDEALERAMRHAEITIIGPLPQREPSPHNLAVANVTKADRRYRRVKAQSTERVKRYRQARDEAVRAAHAEGLSYATIAAVLGVSQSRVQQLVERAGSEPPGGPDPVGALTPEQLALFTLMFPAGPEPSGDQTPAQAENFGVTCFQWACGFEGLPVPDEQTIRLAYVQRPGGVG